MIERYLHVLHFCGNPYFFHVFQVHSVSGVTLFKFLHMRSIKLSGKQTCIIKKIFWCLKCSFAVQFCILILVMENATQYLLQLYLCFKFGCLFIMKSEIGFARYRIFLCVHFTVDGKWSTAVLQMAFQETYYCISCQPVQ